MDRRPIDQRVKELAARRHADVDAGVDAAARSCQSRDPRGPAALPNAFARSTRLLGCDGEPGAHDLLDRTVVLGKEQAARGSRNRGRRRVCLAPPDAGGRAERERNGRSLLDPEPFGGGPDEGLLQQEF